MMMNWAVIIFSRKIPAIRDMAGMQQVVMEGKIIIPFMAQSALGVLGRKGSINPKINEGDVV
ncbi:hypothetical protein [Rhodocaloribacter sp.]